MQESEHNRVKLRDYMHIYTRLYAYICENTRTHTKIIIYMDYTSVHGNIRIYTGKCEHKREKLFECFRIYAY